MASTCCRRSWLASRNGRVAGWSVVAEMRSELRGQDQLSVLRDAQLVLASVMLDDDFAGATQMSSLRMRRGAPGRAWPLLRRRWCRVRGIAAFTNDNDSHSQSKARSGQ